MLLSNATRTSWAQATAAACGIAEPMLVTGTPLQAAAAIEQRRLSPTHIILDVGQCGLEVLAEIDALAQQCKVGTRVIAVGDSNDILLYRGLLSRGVIEYLPMPAEPAQVAKLLMTTETAPRPSVPAMPAPTSDKSKRVISFFSAGSGDGASTAALNTAFALSQMHPGRTVLIDADYQYGMIAKQLNLSNAYGIRELFEHPERGIDTTLIHRMAVPYQKLQVITAPSDLQFLPNISTQVIADLITSLKRDYDAIVIDLPHLWTPWIAMLLQHSTHLVLVAQLWLKSVSHAARSTRMVRELDIPLDRLVPVINRSGAKFKEAIKPKDFEKVCGVPIRYTLANDIRTVTAAETAAKTVMEMEDSPLKSDILRLARGLAGGKPLPTNAPKSGLFTRLKPSSG